MLIISLDMGRPKKAELKASASLDCRDFMENFKAARAAIAFMKASVAKNPEIHKDLACFIDEETGKTGWRVCNAELSDLVIDDLQLIANRFYNQVENMRAISDKIEQSAEVPVKKSVLDKLTPEVLEHALETATKLKAFILSDTATPAEIVKVASEWNAYFSAHMSTRTLAEIWNRVDMLEKEKAKSNEL